MQFKNVLQRIFTAIEKNAIVHFIIAVSYTHLTLPTIA